MLTVCYLISYVYKTTTIKIKCSFADKMERRTCTTAAANTATFTNNSFGKSYIINRSDLLGIGGEGKVFGGIRKQDNIDVAIKELNKQNISHWEILDGHFVPMEIYLLDKVRDVQGVVHLLDFYKESKKFLIVMERPSNSQSLFQYMNEHNYLSESHARIFFKQIVMTIIDIQKCGVAHRDVKCDNILVNVETNELKLIDFGVGVPLDQDVGETFRATYAPPEFEECYEYYGIPATVWTLGIVLHKMVCGFNPFGEIEPLLPLQLSMAVKDLLKKCLSDNPHDRPSLNDILSHPWMNEDK